MQQYFTHISLKLHNVFLNIFLQFLKFKIRYLFNLTDENKLLDIVSNLHYRFVKF